MTCEDMAQQLGTDAYAPEPGCPADATCGTCCHCRKAPQDDPFWWVKDKALQKGLRETCGICEQDHDVVMLDTTPDDMPCGGDFWEAR